MTFSHRTLNIFKQRPVISNNRRQLPDLPVSSNLSYQRSHDRKPWCRSKKVEEHQNRATNEPESVPAYGEHVSDQLYYEIPNYGTGLPSFDEPDMIPDPDPEIIRDAPPSPPFLPDYLLGGSPSTSLRSPSPMPTQTGPLSLTLDKALIFPNIVPATALYSLNYTLNSMGSSITLRLSVLGPVRSTGQTGKVQDKDLYDITRPPFNNSSFQIHGKRQSTYPGTGDLKMRVGLRGRYWECRFKNKVVLKSKAGVWEDGNGRVVAREVNEILAKREEKMIGDGVSENPGLNLESGVEELLLDLTVAVWCAKTWYSQTYESKLSSRLNGHSTRAVYD